MWDGVVKGYVGTPGSDQAGLFLFESADGSHVEPSAVGVHTVRLEPNTAATFDSRGVAYLKLGQWAAAIADYDAALRLNPKLPTALYGRGFARTKMGDLTRGKSDVAAAKSVDKNVVTEFARYDQSSLTVERTGSDFPLCAFIALLGSLSGHRHAGRRRICFRKPPPSACQKVKICGVRHFRSSHTGLDLWCRQSVIVLRHQAEEGCYAWNRL